MMEAYPGFDSREIVTMVFFKIRVWVLPKEDYLYTSKTDMAGVESIEKDDGTVIEQTGPEDDFADL
jgi:hypothetical protein